MQEHLENEVERLQVLRQHCADLKKIASVLSADNRWKSTPLDRHDPLVLEAQTHNVYIGIPLTLGTLLAGVLGKLESVETAIHALERQVCPDVILAQQAQREAMRQLER